MLKLSHKPSVKETATELPPRNSSISINLHHSIQEQNKSKDSNKLY